MSTGFQYKRLEQDDDLEPMMVTHNYDDDDDDERNENRPLMSTFSYGGQYLSRKGQEHLYLYPALNSVGGDSGFGDGDTSYARSQIPKVHCFIVDSRSHFVSFISANQCKFCHFMNIYRNEKR